MGCFQVSRFIFVLPLGDIFLLGQDLTAHQPLLHSGFQTEKTHGYREGSNMLLSKSSGLLSNQNPGDTVAFPTEEDLMQVPRNKSMQIT